MATNNTPDDPALLLHAWHDGELDPANALAMERRIAADPALAAESARIAALRSALRDKLPRNEAPAGLQHRVERAVGLSRARAHPTWMALAASIVIAVMASSGATWLALRVPANEMLADAIVSSHTRALMAPQPIDIVSTDRHTVKPWFNGRLPESPRVIDLASDDFPLVGGRIDVIERMPVPTLVYRHRQHLISLVALAAGASAIPAPRAIEGYNIVRWSDGGTDYWAVSDVALADLEKFAQLFRNAPADQ